MAFLELIWRWFTIILEPIRICFTIIILTLTLFTYLGLGYRWILKLLDLIVYTLLLLPGFIQVAYYYFFTSRGPKSLKYGCCPRNRLDLYLPRSIVGPQKPVLIFVTGGAWIIGYKAWGSLLAMKLAERNIIVVCLDYRNFPQGTISDMIADVTQGIAFVHNNIRFHGGDPNRIYLMGQSAGAHICACVLVQQAIIEANEEHTSWSACRHISAFFGLSGGYNIPDLVHHFHARGLYSSIFLRIMEGPEFLKRFSPEVLVRLVRTENFGALLPRIFLYHGTSDDSIPYDASTLFERSLNLIGSAQVFVNLFIGKSHTDLSLHEPLRGGKCELLDCILDIIHEDGGEVHDRPILGPPLRRLVPDFLLRLARRVCPF